MISTFIPRILAEITWKELDTKLHLPLSDMSATLYPKNILNDENYDLSGSIIIAGGCSHIHGNKQIIDSTTGEVNYYCNEISSQVYVFNPYTYDITTLPDMLVPRYRHSAAVINKKLYVIGGRTLEDNIINHVDVLDLQLKSWIKLMTLPDQYLSSDNTALVYGTKIYVLGGYDIYYNALTTNLVLDVITRELEEKSSMLVARGDAQAVTYKFHNTTRAYIMGGFTHRNGFCDPLYEGEMYDFDNNKWTVIDSLSQNRADKAVVMCHNKIFAIGGETKHKDMCIDINIYNESLAPESHVVTVPDIESYIVTDTNPQWRKEINIPFHRFRAAAVAIEPTATVYVFGGQEAYDDRCNCYKTSNLIFSFTDDSFSHHQENMYGIQNQLSFAYKRPEPIVGVFFLSIVFAWNIMHLF